MKILTWIVARIVLLIACLVAPSLFAREVEVTVFNGCGASQDLGAGFPRSEYFKVIYNGGEVDAWIPMGSTAKFYATVTDGSISTYSMYGGWAGTTIPDDVTAVQALIMANNASYTLWKVPPSSSGSSSPSVLTSDEMETFKLGFWFVVSCGLFIVILGLARMISQQDHRP